MNYTMEFCECGNMLYSKIMEDDNSGVRFINFCKKCGKQNEAVGNTQKPVISNNFNLDSVKKNMTNEYTFDDPTLPQALRVPCPNKNCPTKTPLIKYKVYDTNNMKIMYGCLSCKNAGNIPYVW